ncbi:cupin domain-containing protein [Aestuariivirga sp.]|uniref:cupin domain-containing protein n=1 Tax=Aestuariivirga sp. TaxID=2650926 RepID=UPI0039E4A158
MMMQSLFARATDGEWMTTPEGNRRRVVAHTEELMVVEFAFEAGGEGWLHSHPHVQSSYVAEGTFEVTIDGHSAVLKEGDVYIVPSRLIHGVKALSQGRLIDSFTPSRTDFLTSPGQPK